MKFGFKTFCLTSLACLGLMSQAEARIGTFDVGYGAKSRGMGGVAVALPQDSMVGATNPAGINWFCNRTDLGLQLLSSPRTYTYRNPAFANPAFGGTLPPQGKFRGYSEQFLLPDFGYTQWLDSDSAWGFTFYTAGGETVYKRNNPIASLYGSKPLSQKVGIQLAQYLLALSYSRWITPSQSVGVSLVGCLESLNVRGFHAFDNALASVAPHHVTNRGRDWAGGAAIRFGYLGEIYEDFTFGASYTTRTATSRFRRYKGIVTQSGRLEVPANLSLGLTWNCMACSRISFEWQRYFYRDLPVFHNSINNFSFAGGTEKTGAEKGPGFGWDNIDVYKIGADYEYDSCWKFRGGWCLSQVPYSNTQLNVNVYTQNMARHHLTFGFTYNWDECTELDFAYFHMFRTRLSGPGQINVPTDTALGSFTIGTLTQRMYQDSFTFSIGRTW